MVKTRRSSHVSSPSLMDPRKRRALIEQPSPDPRGIHGCTTRKEVCIKLIRELFCRSSQRFWFKLLPEDDGIDDISMCTGLEWPYLLPLLIYCSLVTFKVGSVVKEAIVVLDQWEELKSALSKHVRLELNTVRQKGNIRVHYFCLGKPVFKNPLQQHTAIVQCDDEHRSEIRKLRVNIKEQARRLLQRRQYTRVVHTNDSSNDEAPNDATEEEIKRVTDEVHCKLEIAEQLSLVVRPRLSRTNGSIINVCSDRVQADERARNMVIHTAILWGWRDPYKTVQERNRIAAAACNQVAYDLGYPRILAVTQMPKWHAMLYESIAFGENADPLSPSNAWKTTYTKIIEETHPGYLHELFRYAQKVYGALATFTDIARCMNEKPAAPGETRPTLSLSRRMLSCWFYQQGGTTKSAIEKPLLTQVHKEARQAWVLKYFGKLSDPNTPVAFLDEKWFYTTSHRRRLKLLPKGEEEEVDPTYVSSKIRSRRYPVKVMYLGVVACPNDTHHFDGRIFMKRVSKRESAKKASRNQRFSVDVHINESLRSGGWRHLAVEEHSVGGLLDLICTTYDLDEFVADRLEISYYTFTNTRKVLKPVQQEQIIGEMGFRKKEDGSEAIITVDDLNLYVLISQGDELDQDCSCDSTFMLTTIPEVGRSLREKFHWVQRDEPVYLVMDNAGGHGTNDAIIEYTKALKEFNVEIIWQVPRSPETNMLDLGVWMSVQSAVEQTHRGRRCQHDALAKSVEDAWTSYLNSQAFKNVFNRLRVVLRCIQDDEGGNEKVEKKRGKLFRDATLIDLTVDGKPKEYDYVVIDNMDNNDNDSITSL